MRKYKIFYNSLERKKYKKIFTFKEMNLKCIFTPIITNDYNNGIDYLNDNQKKQLKEVLFSCFKYETKQSNSDNININFPNNIYGNVCIFDMEDNLLGFMITLYILNRFRKTLPFLI